MIRILITPAIIKLAKDFAVRLAQGYNAIQELTNLENAISSIGANDYCLYINRIIQNYNEIIAAVPNNFNRLNPISGLIIDFKRKFSCNGKKPLEFHKLVVKALGYDWVRNNLYPEFAQRLGIKTCVYCNAQYGVTVKKHTGQYTSSYEIDHFMPKSEFPYLATSFFNLQPSCGHCNSQKSIFNAKFNLYTSDRSSLRPFSFVVSPHSITNFLLNHDDKNLRLELTSNDQALLTDHENHFHITEKYKNHNDEAADLIIMSLYL